MAEGKVEEKRPTSARRITKERHDRVTWSGVCPGCGNYRIVTLPRFTRDVLDRNKAKYGGSYLCCGGPNEHRCWNMTKNANAARLYETFGDEPSEAVKQA